jgi:hypothetical protein
VRRQLEGLALFEGISRLRAGAGRKRGREMAALPVLPIHSIVTMEDSTVVVMARVLGTNRLPLTQGGIASIRLAVADYTTKDSTYQDFAVSVAATVFNSLQTDARWTADPEGYNFRYVVPHTAFPLGGRTYRIEAKFIMTDGSVGYVPWQVRTEPRKTTA